MYATDTLRPVLQQFDLARLRRVVRLGLKTLWMHRLRSLLTVLGIVFGVCSVIAMLAIGEGASYEAQEQIARLGSQNIILTSVKPADDQRLSQSGRTSFVLQYGLTYRDLNRIRLTIPGITIIVPSRITRDYVWNINRRVECEIHGTVPWYPEMRNHKVAAGRFFTMTEMENCASVCVLGAEVVPILFPFQNPIGSDVRVGSYYYRVIGVMEARAPAATGTTPAGSKPVLYQMFIPLETAKARYGEVLVRRRTGSLEAERVQLHEVTVRVHNRDRVLAVAEAIKEVLERNHKKKDYEVIVPLELLRQAERTKQIFNIVLGSIAAISLLVGGIGIMNIMLATVTERTREIGIRRALGARRRDILSQFLIESVILAGIGGLLGVGLGVLIPFFVTRFAGMRTIITFWSPMLAFGISAVVGIVFGLYPARRAALMDPVEALRHE
ncbi:MAG: ABC transporter permease [Verrucomicrobiae bacterium]|nr:ABC transporter permease [Verrucomicrobiae bacterium]